MDDKKDNQEVVKRLDLIISLMLEKDSSENSITTTDKVKKLNDLGLKTLEIANILGKNNNYINVVISRLKVSKPKKG